jgi:hypothetical protein
MNQALYAHMNNKIKIKKKSSTANPPPKKTPQVCQEYFCLLELVGG